MARQPMVTRTITTTKVTLLCLNLVSAEPFNTTVVLPRTFNDEKKLLSAAQAVIDSEEQKAVHIVSKEEIETLYGMTEQDFINNAHELDKETRRILDNEDVLQGGEEAEEKPKAKETEEKPKSKNK